MRGSDRQLLAAQHMEMQVGYRLAAILSHIGHHAVAFFASLFPAKAGNDAINVAQQGGIFFRKLLRRRNFSVRRLCPPSSRSDR